jgi:hypothetical protein
MQKNDINIIYFMKNHPIGSKINNWTINGNIYFSQSGKHKKSKINCICKCGKEKDVWVMDLKNGKSVCCKSCSTTRPHKDKPKPIIENGIAKIYLTGKYSHLYIIFDIEDIPIICQHRWYAAKSSKQNAPIYARTHKNNRHYRFTQILFNNNILYDHIDGNPLNNQKSNLRPCTVLENGRNKSKTKNKKTSTYLGTCFDKNRNKWVASVWLNNKCVWQKRFDTELEAATARDQKAKKIYGEFAKLNFPESSLDKGLSTCIIKEAAQHV